MLWAFIYVVQLATLLVYGVIKSISKSLKYWLILNIVLTFVFVCVFLGLTSDPLAAIIVSVLIFMSCVGAVPVAYQNI